MTTEMQSVQELATETRSDGPQAAATDTSDDRVDSGKELGSVQIHHNVVATIARLAALKVPGVVEMSGTFVDGLAGMINSKKSVDRGIHVEFVESEVIVELHVVLEFGVRIPHVAWQIQNEVRQAIEQMTGKPVRSVDIVVQTLKFPDEKKDDSRQGDSL